MIIYENIFFFKILYFHFFWKKILTGILLKKKKNPDKSPKEIQTNLLSKTKNIGLQSKAWKTEYRKEMKRLLRKFENATFQSVMSWTPQTTSNNDMK